MCEVKWLLKVSVIVLVVEGCHLISTRSNGTAEILWNLTGRSLGRVPGGSRYPYPGLPPVAYGFMDALASIAQNDELHCVPRLLCELTSTSGSATKQTLPFDINMNSLLVLLSSLNGGGGSPLLLFGRAALLGYTSNGNSAPCQYSYPRCPTDPDKLVNYLNNYNGGFFRYFNGVPRPQRFRAEGRIQTRPATSNKDFYVGDNRFRIKFPVDEGYLLNELGFYRYKSGKTLTFPGEQSKDEVNNVLDFQRPLPDHIASPIIFPTRTGTGELLLDSDAFTF